MQVIRRRIFVEGSVQGVFFRDGARRAAQSLGVRGWVRNLRDGRVEVLAEGDPPAVGKLIDWCRAGPPAARVERVEVIEEADPEGLTGFTIRY
ncbi:MAG: acylphosphatase [Nitrospirota bacterium]|mgnify:FL=1|jgi:acylphosphatase